MQRQKIYCQQITKRQQQRLWQEHSINKSRNVDKLQRQQKCQWRVWYCSVKKIRIKNYAHGMLWHIFLYMKKW